jgi:hypothetical protein
MNNHPDLMSIMVAEIPATAKLLYSAMYARTNGAMTGSIPVDDLCRELGGISSGTLRNLRAAVAPWAITAVERGYLLFFLRCAAEPRAEMHATDAKMHATDAFLHDAETAPAEPRAEMHATDAFLHATDAFLHANPPTPPEEEELINLPGTEPTPPPLTPPTAPTVAEQQRTYALLTDQSVGMSWAKARECQAKPFLHCLAHALAWQTESAALTRSGVRKPFTAGLLAHRIQKFPTPALAWEYSQLELLRAHAPELLAQPDDPEDLPPDPQPDPQPQTAPLAWLCTTAVPCLDGEREAHEVWTIAMSQLRLQMTTNTWDTFVRDTRCQAYGGGAFVIAVANAYAKDWLSLRLRPMIKRTLTSIVGKAVDVSFEVGGGS